MGAEGEDRGTCALDGCDNSLPPPARDERGRLKGGKPVRYCGKAHADEASRRRRALESVGVEEPLHLLRALGGETREAMDAALTEFAEIRRRWDELDAGAVAQSARDRAETAEAMLKVHRAERAADDAERAMNDAVTAAAQDRQLRTVAEQAAETAVREAEQTRKAAWEQTAEHERARGQAETRATLAEQGQRDALDMLEATRRELRDLKTLQQDTLRRMTDATAASERADAARELAEAKIAGAEQRARLAGDAARQAELATQRAQQETEAARHAETEARAHAQTTIATLSQAQDAQLQRLAAQDTTLAELRAQLDAAHQRERQLHEAAAQREKDLPALQAAAHRQATDSPSPAVE